MPFEEHIALTGELSIKDARQGVRLMNASFIGKLFHAAVILGMLGCLWELWQLVMFTDAEDLSGSDEILIAICFTFPSLLLMRYAWVHERWRHLREKKFFYFRPSATVLHSSGISLSTESYRAEYAWEYFTEFRRTDRVVVLFSSGGGMFFGRSRFANDADWERFVNFVESRFKRRD
jgi:hypothetical protein